MPAEPPSNPIPDVRSRAWLWTCAGLLAAAHIALLNHFVPLRAIFSQHPLQGIDFDLHIGQVFRVVDALEHWGKSWLYDVQLLAGEPEGTITDSGSKGWELWTFALHHFGVPKPLAFNLFVLVAMLGCPVLIFAAGRCFQMTPAQSLLGATMASTLWFFDSHIHWIWFVGMVSWGLASCLTLVTLGLFHRLLESGRLRWMAPCALALGVNLLIHPYTFFVLTPPMAALYLRRVRVLPRPVHAAVAAIVTTALSMNAYWLHNAAKHWHYILDSAYYAQANPKHLVCDLLDVLCNAADTGAIGTRTAFRFLYLALAAAGLWLWRTRSDARFLPFCTAIVALYTYAYFGGLTPQLQQTQPYRHITPAALFTTLPAAACVHWLWEQRRGLRAAPGSRLLVLILSGVLVKQLLTSQVLYFFPTLIPEPAVHPDGVRSPLSGYGYYWVPGYVSNLDYRVPHDPVTFEGGGNAIVSWLRTQVPRGSRVLIESSVLGERVAWSTQLEVLGGFFERNVMHVDANYFREHQHHFAKPDALLHYMCTFAVEWVVSDRPEFARIPQVLQVAANVSGRLIYKNVAPCPRMLKGNGVVRATHNQIEVIGSDPAQTLVLSYHWHEALRCSPNCGVERETSDIDRVGFVRVPAPHPVSLRVWNSYEMP